MPAALAWRVCLALAVATVNVTGKVKLIAVSESVPRKLMNQVSTRLKVNSMNMPTIMGSVIRIRDCRIEPSTRLLRLSDFWFIE